MRSVRDRRIRFVLPALLALLCASCGISKNNRYWQAIEAYKTAEVVPGEDQSGQGYPGKTYWKSEMTLRTGTRVSVEACYCGPANDSQITVHYSDEQEARVVYDYVDYVYPADVRIEGTVLLQTAAFW